MQLYQPTITGSLSVSGSINISGSINVVGGSGTITGTASYASNADTLDGAHLSVLATTSSNTFTGVQTVNSNLVVTGSITAQTLVVQTVTSSVIYSSGSNVFGNNIANTQTFTGSMNLTGSLTVVTTGTEFQVNANGVKFGNVIGDAHNITGSVLVSGSFGLNKAVPQRQYTQVANTNGIVFTIQNAAASNEGYIVGFDATGSTYVQLSNLANSPAVYLNSSGSSYFIGGNVGIGATNPTNRLEIIGVSGSTGIITPLYVQGWNATTSVGGTNTSYGGIQLTNNVDTTLAIRLLGSGHVQFATDSSGRFISFATNNFIERMRITSDGNIQIDNGQLNTPKSLSFQANSNTGGNLGSIDWYNFQWDGLLRAQIKGETDTALANGRLVFSTGAGGVTERMRISSTGVVTKPFQPLAMGGMADNQSVAATTFTSIAFNTSYGFNQANVGSCWNNSTSTFTAPATGVYLINAALFTSNVGQIAAFINGNRTISMVSTTSTFPTTWHGTIMIKLTSGDALTLRGYGDASGVITQNTYHTWFGIYLLG